MELTAEQLDEIENFAGLYFTVEEVALILELDPEKFRELYHDKSGDVYKRYTKGYLISESKVRKCLLDLALRNSSPAQDAIRKLSKDTRNKNMSYE
ncbi:MAG TPA: hypothetical protein PKD91_01960 [Bacteroidia bacterium]|nr:hypothetical protein [Bacteroidia bacterium]